MKIQKYLPVMAIIVLMVGITATVYVNSTKVDATQIIINSNEFTVDHLFQIAEERSIESESGIALDHLMKEIGVSNPEMLQYTLIGADGYQKTVLWKNLQNGILTRNRESVFSDLPKAYSVKEIVEIKVE